MSSESVCLVARRVVEVGNFHTRLFGVVYMMCGNFHNGSKKGTVSVHQNLCQSWEKCYTDPHSDSTSLRGPNVELYADVSMELPSVDDDEHTGRLTSSTTPENVARIQELVRQDRRRIIHNIAEEVGIGYGTCPRVLTNEFGIHRVAASP
jgi:hypothetical protein